MAVVYIYANRVLNDLLNTDLLFPLSSQWGK